MCMNIQFDDKFLKHKEQNTAEGSYHIEQFPERNKNTDANREEAITLVQTVNYKKLIYND